MTVWATEQEDPAKTINKWKRIPNPDQGPTLESESETQAERRPEAEEEEEEPPRVAEQASADGQSVGQQGRMVEGEVSGGPAAPAGGGAKTASGEPSEEGADFFVPWNLPCHRAEAQGALSKQHQQVRGMESG